MTFQKSNSARSTYYSATGWGLNWPHHVRLTSDRVQYGRTHLPLRDLHARWRVNYGRDAQLAE
eukprot:6870415-Prymnesium_polylepis.1